MMAGELPICTSEDIHNIPVTLRNLDVQSLSDETCLTLKKRWYFCCIQGKGDPCHGAQRHLATRTGTFRGRGVNGFSPQLLAETGLFQRPNGCLTCYQCGQTLRLLAGEGPLEKHVDLYPNCAHVCRMLGRRPRSMISTLTSPPTPSVSRRRRLFSE